MNTQRTPHARRAKRLWRQALWQMEQQQRAHEAEVTELRRRLAEMEKQQAN